MVSVVLIVAMVTLGAPFGVAEAAALSDDDGVTVAMSVEVDGSFTALLVRPFSSFEELPPTAMRDRGNGTWGATVVLPTAENWSIVFEAIDPAGEVIRSDSTTLLALGVDPVVVAPEPPEAVPSGGVDASTIWLLGAVILALSALGALAYWTFTGDEPST